MIFSKYEGAGNDFILIDDRSLSFDVSLVAPLCHRKWGIGADGVILLQPDFRMRIFNSDGSEAESCGNGLRCLVRFAYDLGLSPERILMHDRLIGVWLAEQDVAVRLGEPRNLSLNLPLNLGHSTLTLHLINTGVPHAILFAPSFPDIALLGPQIRRHPAFAPHGVNVNFAIPLPDGSFSLRTFERGVEAETLACGTGAAATAVIASILFSTPSPITIRCPGGPLQISFSDPDFFSDLALIGPARRVFEGSYHGASPHTPLKDCVL